MSRRLILPAVAAMALALPAPAPAIVNGDPAAEGPYRGQAFVGRDTDGDTDVDEYCTGTLIGSRQVLTAARCATYGLGVPLPEAGFKVRLGDVDLADAVLYAVARREIHADYNRTTGANDLAILTLEQPVAHPPVRVVDADERAAWQPGKPALVLGWGETSQGGFVSSFLRTGDVFRLPDADCSNPGFDPALMLCAVGTPAADSENPCAGDSGSPLAVPDGNSYALAGVFSGASCATAGAPGIFARVGDGPLNAWVHALTPEADFRLSHQPRAREPVTLFSTSRHPEGASYFTTFNWDLDNDGAFDDATGASISHTYAAPGQAVAGLEAFKPGGDRASAYFRFDVNQAPAGGATTTPPSANPVARVRLATILAARRPRVRGRRFSVRVRFARTAPRGVAVIEVHRGSRRIGSGRTRVRRGATKRVSVKLTPAGARQLRRAANGRLQVRVRVRVGRRVLRTRRLTIRR